jgi:DNA modification methylase
MLTLYNLPCYEATAHVQNKSVDLVLTDPPYDWDDELKKVHHEELVRICCGAIIVFCPPENLWQPKCDQTLFWIKPISTKNTSKSYSRFVEIIQVWNGTIWNSDGHWSQYTNVFYDLVDSKIHPFKKPDSMVLRLLRNHSHPGNTVFDGFFGSGTVPRLCENTDRNCIASEIDEDLFSEFQTYANAIKSRK